MLPRDVWVQIAEYVPPRQLLDLISVNSALFEIAMDCRYRQISIDYFDNRLLRVLARLQDPHVAKRVRILHVYPAFLQGSLDNNRPKRRSIRDRITDLAATIRNTPQHPRLKLMHSLRTTDELVRLMLTLLPNLPNLSDYHLSWSGLPPSITPHAVPLLTSLFHPPSSSALRKLSLDLSLDNIRALLGSSTSNLNSYPPIQELSITLHPESTCACRAAAILTDILAPAVLRLSSSLKHLSIQSWEEADLSPLFLALSSPSPSRTPALPLLERLEVAIPVESKHLGDPGALARFLLAHRGSLRVLKLRATQVGGRGLTPDPISLDNWIRRLLLSCSPSSPSSPPPSSSSSSSVLQSSQPPSPPTTTRSSFNLTHLDISSSLFPLPTALACIETFSALSAHTLTSLSITGHYRSLTHVLDALDAIQNPRKLRKLKLGLVELSPQLVDLLAGRLVALEELELVVRCVVPVDGSAGAGQGQIVGEGKTLRSERPGTSESCTACLTSKEAQKAIQVDAFIHELSQRSYSSWPLRRLSIFTKWFSTTNLLSHSQSFSALTCTTGDSSSDDSSSSSNSDDSAIGSGASTPSHYRSTLMYEESLQRAFKGCIPGLKVYQ